MKDNSILIEKKYNKKQNYWRSEIRQFVSGIKHRVKIEFVKNGRFTNTSEESLSYDFSFTFEKRIWYVSIFVGIDENNVERIFIYTYSDKENKDLVFEKEYEGFDGIRDWESDIIKAINKKRVADMGSKYPIP